MYAKIVQAVRKEKKIIWKIDGGGGIAVCIKEKRPTFVERFLKLSRKDSNPHRRNQNPKCYHYTTGQFLSFW